MTNIVTDEQIRTERRRDPRLIDTLMVAIYSDDPMLRRHARQWFAAAINARRKIGMP